MEERKEVNESSPYTIEDLKRLARNEVEFPVVDVVEDSRWKHRLKSYYHKPIKMKKKRSKKWKNGKK